LTDSTLDDEKKNTLSSATIDCLKGDGFVIDLFLLLLHMCLIVDQMLVLIISF
jgi:hypothetical protein